MLIQSTYSKYDNKQKKSTATASKSCIQSRIRVRIRNPLYEAKDPDSYQNVNDPEHWFLFRIRIRSMQIQIQNFNTIQIGHSNQSIQKMLLKNFKKF